MRETLYAAYDRVKKLTSGPINAIFFDQKHGTLWGGSSNYRDDYAVVW